MRLLLALPLLTACDPYQPHLCEKYKRNVSIIDECEASTGCMITTTDIHDRVRFERQVQKYCALTGRSDE